MLDIVRTPRYTALSPLNAAAAKQCLYENWLRLVGQISDLPTGRSPVHRVDGLRTRLAWFVAEFARIREWGSLPSCQRVEDPCSSVDGLSPSSQIGNLRHNGPKSCDFGCLCDVQFLA